MLNDSLNEARLILLLSRSINLFLYFLDLRFTKFIVIALLASSIFATQM